MESVESQPLDYQGSVYIYIHEYVCVYILVYIMNYGASQVVLVLMNPPANAGDIGDVGLTPGLGIYPGGGHGKPSSILA